MGLAEGFDGSTVEVDDASFDADTGAAGKLALDIPDTVACTINGNTVSSIGIDLSAGCNVNSGNAAGTVLDVAINVSTVVGVDISSDVDLDTVSV